MTAEFEGQFEALVSKYTELLVGQTNEELDRKVEMWALYSHIAKSMPALASHWNKEFPEAKNTLKELMEEIRSLNEQNRKNKKQ